MGTKKGWGAEGPPGKRPRGPRPSLPEEIAGLFAALRESRGVEDRPVRQWVAKNQPRVEAALRSWGRNAADARMLADLLVEEAFLASMKGVVIQREVPWLSGTAAHLWQKTCSTRRKEKEKEKEKEKAVPIDEIPSSSPTPFEVLSEADESNHQKEKVLAAAHLLPPPYGHVLHWRLTRSLSWKEIRDQLNTHRSPKSLPISGRQAQHLVTQALQMFRALRAGTNPRSSHPQKYLRNKNPWIVATLPLLPSLI